MNAVDPSESSRRDPVEITSGGLSPMVRFCEGIESAHDNASAVRSYAVQATL